MTIFKALLGIATQKTQKKLKLDQLKKQNPSDFYEIQINDIRGNLIDLAQFKGKNILICNTASKCGFTKQLGDLQKLQDESAEDLVVIGVPCNDFGGQEPGSHEEICEFALENYNAKFLMTEKVSSDLNTGHKLLRYLCENAPIGGKINWNFEKFTISREGMVTNRFTSDVGIFDEQLLKEVRR